VEQVVDRRTTVVFSTHILSDLERVAVDVAFLSGGRIALHAPLDELLESSMRLGGVPADIERFVREHSLKAISRDASGPVIARAPDAAAVPPAIPTVSVDRVTLEDLFLALTA
jgi:ABC-2 type transport system ATP-binding protein